MRFLLLQLLLVLLPATALAEELVGRASVIDGDTLEIHGTRIRLFGIDAVESSQYCQRNEQNWACGRSAAFALADHIGTQPLRCMSRGKDRYRRLIAICYLGNEDLNGWLVREGWALAYRRYARDYVDLEQAAKAARRNIWASEFQVPEQYRRGRRQLKPG